MTKSEHGTNETVDIEVKIEKYGKEKIFGIAVPIISDP